MKIFLSSNPPLKHHFTHQKEPENKTASRHATDNKTAQCALATRYGEEGEGREQNCAILTGHNVQPGGSGCPHRPQRPQTTTVQEIRQEDRHPAVRGRLLGRVLEPKKRRKVSRLRQLKQE